MQEKPDQNISREKFWTNVTIIHVKVAFLSKTKRFRIPFSSCFFAGVSRFYLLMVVKQQYVKNCARYDMTSYAKAVMLSLDLSPPSGRMITSKIVGFMPGFLMPHQQIA